MHLLAHTRWCFKPLCHHIRWNLCWCVGRARWLGTWSSYWTILAGRRDGVSTSLGFHWVCFLPDRLVYGVYRLQTRRYDCARFAFLTPRDWHPSLRLIGVSPELSTLIPDRIVSLSLIVTTAGGRIWNNFPPVRLTRTNAYTSLRTSS